MNVSGVRRKIQRWDDVNGMVMEDGGLLETPEGQAEGPALTNPLSDNPLKNAPHTTSVVTADDWTHPYSRQTAAFPLPYVAAYKFWPSVGRVNDSHGDRALICACPPIESYMEEEAMA